MKVLRILWDDLVYWARETRMLAAIFAAAGLAALVTWFITNHPDKPGGCQDDRAGVVSQLQSLHYKMDECTQDDHSLYLGWWTRKGWPSVEARQLQDGAPVTITSLSMDTGPGTAVDQWLEPTPDDRNIPAAKIVVAANTLLEERAKLVKLPFRVDCVTGTHVVRVNDAAGQETVWFNFYYGTAPSTGDVRPPPCPTG